MTREKGTLTVTVVQAKDIPKTDLMGFGDADPFVVFTITPGLPVGDLPKLAVDAKNDKVQRTQIGEPVNPIWHETFKVMLDTEVPELWINLFDADRGRKDEHLGTAALPLSSVNYEKEWILDEWVEFKRGKANGAKVQLLVHFQPQTVLDHLGKKFNEQVAVAKQSVYQKAVQSAVKMATGFDIRAPVGQT